MTPFKRRDGFTFIEVVIALAIIAIALMSLLGLQQAGMQSCANATDTLRRILILKNVLYDPAVLRDKHNEELPAEKKIKEPATTIITKREKIANPKLKAYELEQIIARAQWEALWGTRSEALSVMRFVVPKKKDRV